MKKPMAAAGHFANGVPYNRVGGGPRPLVIFQGLVFDSRPLPAAFNWLYDRYYRYLADDFTTYIVTRKSGLAANCSLRDLANDYAELIGEAFGGPVDVWGVSTGGSIALQFAADHPGLVRRLIIHSSAHTLSDSTRLLQRQIAALARRRQWRAAYATMLAPTKYPRLVVWLSALVAGALAVPPDPSDLVATIEAEDRLHFRERLPEISAPTLVAACDQDPYYPAALFRETAAGIPNARLALYPGVGHPASGAPFRRDVLAFLRKP